MREATLGQTVVPGRSGRAINVGGRFSVWLWALAAMAVTAARIIVLESPDPQRDGPFLSANDRSRWCTIRSLAEYNTFAIDAVIDGAGGERWDTIDKVFHTGPDGRMHFYSSKPPLWPAFLAGQYGVLRQVTGWSLTDHDFAAARILLILNNALALGLLVILVGRCAESLSASPLTTNYLAAAAAFGTSLTPFAVTLTNHLPAAALVAASAWLLLQVWHQGGNIWAYFLVGLLAGLAATLELPATGWLALCMGLMLLRSPVRCLGGALPAAALVAAAFFACNQLAHGTWKPAYDFREDGQVVVSVEGDFATELDAGILPVPLRAAAQAARGKLGFDIEDAPPVIRGAAFGSGPQQPARWIVNRDQPHQWLIVQPEPGGPFQIRLWGNWYDYEGSYWLATNTRKSEVDRGESDTRRYLLHMLVGHHGVFSLTPLFLLSLAGVIPLGLSRHYGIRLWAWGTLALSVVVFRFYLLLPDIDRNYGGMTSGLRWVFWLYPLWLIWAIPVLDPWLGRRWGRAAAGLLLVLSIVSAGLSVGNPWSSPWLETVGKSLGIDW